MRKRYAILIICLSGILFPSRSSAQGEVFPTKDAIWNIYIPEYGAMVTSHYYGFVGDTVFDELSYRKLYLLKDSVLRENPENVYVGGVRVSGKKVFMRPTDTATGRLLEEYLMYDFSAQIGDEIHFGKCPEFIIDYQDITFANVSPYLSEMTGGVEKIELTERGREFEIVSVGHDTWIEGVGSLLGLFFTPAPIPIGKQRWVDLPYGQRSILLCLKVGDEIRYKDPGCEECMEVLNVSENVVIPVTVRQVGNSRLSIQSSENSLPLQFEMLSLSGTVLQRHTIREGDTIIDLHVSVPGIYIYRIIGDKVYKSDKIVVR
ncbi:T9SS type A sorting domain-containing protein [Coprobacter sp.]